MPPRGGSRSSAGGKVFVESVCAAIQKTLAERELTIDRCAGEIGVSRRTLQRLLADFGLTFQDLVDQVRLETAKELLANKNTSVSDIAAELDYANSTSFARAFQRLCDVTPSQFRRNLTSRRPPP